MTRPAALLTLLLLAACGTPQEPARNGGAAAGRPAATEPDAAYVEQFARVELPPSTADLQVRSEVGIDEVLYARFTISRDDLEAFLDSGHFSAAPREGMRAILAPPRALGWDAELAGLNHFLGHQELGAGFARSLVIGLDDPDRAVVFLVATTL